MSVRFKVSPAPCCDEFSPNHRHPPSSLQRDKKRTFGGYGTDAPRSPAGTKVKLMSKHSPAAPGLSRRNFMLAAAGAGAAVAAAVVLPEGYSSAAVTASAAGSGTVPEQIRLTWGADTSSEMTVSWLSLSPQVRPQVLVHRPGGRARVVDAIRSSYTDGLSGEA